MEEGIWKKREERAWEEKDPSGSYRTVQECSGKNEFGSLAQDDPCDWAQMMAVTKNPFLLTLITAMQHRVFNHAIVTETKKFLQNSFVSV